MTRTRIWGNYELETRIEFGSAARSNRGSCSGQKIHRLSCEYIIKVIDPSRERIGTVGHQFLMARKENPEAVYLFSVHPCCGCCQGQNAGKPGQGLTSENVTCTKCLEINKRIAERDSRNCSSSSDLVESSNRPGFSPML